MVVDGTTTGLDDEDIFSTDRVLDFAARLAYREFAQSAIANWEAKDVANILCQGWVGVPAEDDDIANHGDETSGFLKHGVGSGMRRVGRASGQLSKKLSKVGWLKKSLLAPIAVDCWTVRKETRGYNSI